ncbi:MAG: acyltransferase [Bacteroidales bacterium]|nr:acyltransferase [Bacteroidales bacterium]
MKQNIYLSSKPRYDILDGLRGVAAFMVILFHFFENYCPEGGLQHINHGFLAVDFFFVLSGFVIGYAYDDRWDRMTTWGFFKRRLTRLHPMVIAGTVIGANLLFFQASAFPKILDISLWMFLLCFFMGLLMIPCPPSLDMRGWAEMNTFNGPNWSLTYEYLGNILYALVLRRLPKWGLAVLMAVAAFFTLDLTLGWDVLNFFTGGPHYSVVGGWCITPDQIYVGLTRLSYPFLCGLMISRILPSYRSESNPSGSPLHLKGGFWWASIMLVVLFSIPCVGGRHGVPDGLYQAVCILLLFPVIVLVGAGSQTRHSISTKVCKWLGEISYPLYITHYPFIYMHYSFHRAHPDTPLWIKIAISAGVLVISVIVAWGVYKVYDLPVRTWLTERWLKKGSK